MSEALIFHQRGRMANTVIANTQTAYFNRINEI